MLYTHVNFISIPPMTVFVGNIVPASVNKVVRLQTMTIAKDIITENRTLVTSGEEVFM